MNLAALGNAVSLLAEATPHEKSKTAFYIAGGALAGWAVLVGVFGFTHADFPGSPGRARGVMGISLVLMLTAVLSAAITGSTPAPAPQFVHLKVPAKGTAPPPTPIVSAGAPAAATTPAPSAPPGAVALDADPGGVLKYTQSSLSAKAGRVTIAFSNLSPIPHNVTVAKGSSVLGASPTFQGATKELVLTLSAGSYTYYCTVPGHRDAGMQGTLTVQ